jgi:hypothetical protein
VKIVYDAESDYKADNEAAIKVAKLDDPLLARRDYDAVIPRTVTEGIRHNKFIVLLSGVQPIAVWTGSTNVSAGGIFGHSNVAHVVWDKDIAAKYLNYWELLANNLTPNQLRAPNKAATPTFRGKPRKKSVSPLYSPRDSKESNETRHRAAPNPRLDQVSGPLSDGRKQDPVPFGSSMRAHSLRCMTARSARPRDSSNNPSADAAKFSITS